MSYSFESGLQNEKMARIEKRLKFLATISITDFKILSIKEKLKSVSLASSVFLFNPCKNIISYLEKNVK